MDDAPSERTNAGTQRVLSAVAEHEIAAMTQHDDPCNEFAEAAPVGILGMTPSGDVTFVNERACSLLGRSRESILGEGWAPAVDPEDLPEVVEEWSRDAQSGSEHRSEHRVVGPDGTVRWVLASASPVHAADGTIGSWVSVLTDYTAERNTLVALRESEQRIAQAQRISGIGTYAIDPATREATISDTVAEIYGIPAQADDFFKRAMALIHPEDRERVRSEFKGAMRGEGRFESIYRVSRAHDGSERIVSNHAQLVGDRVVGTIADITEQRQTEQLLNRAQEIAHLGSWEWNIITGDLAWTDEIYRIFGLAPQEFGPSYEAFMERVHPDDRAGIEIALTEAIENHEPYEIEHRIVNPDGAERVVHEKGKVSYAEDGTPLRMLGTVLDVTEHARSRRSLEEFKQTLDATLDCVFMFDAETLRFTYVNRGAIQQVGYEAEELRGLHPYDLAPDFPEDRFRALIAPLLDGDEGSFTFETVQRHKDGHDLPVEVFLQYIAPAEERPRFVAIVRDVTVRRQADAALRASEQRFRSLADNAPVGIYETDADGSCLWVNELWSEISGIPVADALGAGWIAAIHPEDREQVVKLWRQAVRDGTPFYGEYRMRSDGGRVSHLAGRAITLTGPDGEITGYLGTITDITERERRDSEQRALRRIATSVAADAPARATFALVAEQVALALDVSTSTVVQFNTAEQAAIVVGGWSEWQGSVAPGTRFLLDGEGILARVARAGQAVRSEAVEDLTALAGGELDPMPDIAAAAAAPVWMSRAPWGAIAVAGPANSLPPDTEDRLERFCELVSLALSNADARRQLATLASTDHLTGLPNRRSFQERLAAEVERARRHDRPLALVVLDIDHFKKINDRHGHQTGDRTLIEFSRRLSSLARSGEIVARIGGEEFAWILPEADAMGAVAAAERARRRITDEPFSKAGTVTVSGGVCDLEQASDPAELFRFADLALYWAKADGRDRVFRYSPEAIELLSAEEQQRRVRRAQSLTAVRILAKAIDAKDAQTQRHSERVAKIAEGLATASGWTRDRIARMSEAALVHDVGKIGVSDAVLFKPARLNEDEYAAVQQHVTLGARMIEGVLQDDQVAWVRHHHERWDGGGYPAGLTALDIPDGARILALADAFDAMVTERLYAPRLTIEQVVKEAREGSGTQFDPELVSILERLWDEGELEAIDPDLEGVEDFEILS